jgi:tetratricopeptide (TPR) repeat protein
VLTTSAGGPVVSGCVPPLPDSYTPRPDVALSPADFPAGATVALVPETRTVNGDTDLGGSGKTCHAVALTGQLGHQPAVRLIVWITASCREAVVSGYAQALRDVGVAIIRANPDQAAAEFLTWLARAADPWLVVIDDLRGAGTMEGLWPRGPSGRVLVTTESPETVSGAHDMLLVPVGPFRPREALVYLAALRHADTGYRLELASDLAFHPLALALAVEAMSVLGIACQDYRLRLARQAEMTTAAGRASRPWLSAVGLAASVSAGVADLLPPAGLASRALALVSVLAPHGIPQAVLSSDAASRYITGQPASPEQRADASAAVGNLARAGLASIDYRSPSAAVLVHPAIHALVRTTLPPAGSAGSVLKAAADALWQTWLLPDIAPAVAQRLRDCTASLHSVAGSLLWAGDCHPVLLHAGRSLEESRMTAAAADYWLALLATSRRELGVGHPRTSELRRLCAAACEECGRLNDAIALREGELSAHAMLGSPGPGTARLELSRTYLAAGHYDDAVRLAREALSDSAAVPGASAEGVLARECAARGLLAAGRRSEAVSELRQVLADRERLQGRDDPQTIAACAELAATCVAAGELKEAITLGGRAVSDFERTHGPEHPDTLAARSGLASAYLAARKTKAAVTLYQRVLDGRERVLGSEHPETITARSDLAAAYLAAGTLAYAVAEYERALEACVRAYGPGHDVTKGAELRLNAAVARGMAVRGINLRSPRSR